MGKRIQVNGDGDYELVGTPFNIDRWTVAFPSDGAADPASALGGATLRFFGVHTDPDEGVESTPVPLQNGQVDATTTDDDGNDLLSFDIYSGFSRYFMRVSGFTVPFDVWYGPT